MVTDLDIQRFSEDRHDVTRGRSLTAAAVLVVPSLLNDNKVKQCAIA